MKKITLLIFCLYAINSVGQKKIHFGLGSSIGFNSYERIDVGQIGDLLSYKGNTNYSFGLTLGRKVGSKFFMKTGLYYSIASFSEIVNVKKLRPINPDDPLPNFASDLEFIYTTSYIELPLDFQLYFLDNKNLNLYGSLGVSNSIRTNYSRSGDDPLSSGDGIKYKNYVLSSKLGFGANVKINKLIFGFEPQARLYLTSLHETFLTQNPIYFGIEVYILSVR